MAPDRLFCLRLTEPVLARIACRVAYFNYFTGCISIVNIVDFDVESGCGFWMYLLHVLYTNAAGIKKSPTNLPESLVPVSTRCEIQYRTNPSSPDIDASTGGTGIGCCPYLHRQM